MNPLPWLSLYPIECVAVAGALAMAVVWWLPERVRRLVGIAGAAVTLVSVVALFVLGLRWQLLPVLAGAVLAVPAVVYVIRRRTPRGLPRWVANLGVLFLVGLVLGGPVSAWAMPVPALPDPTGRYVIGTTVVQWTDEDRQETATEDPDDKRVVVGQLWYPAESGEGERAPYLGRTPEEARTVARGLATYLGYPEFVLDQLSLARTNAVLDASPARGSFPVVLFSPGLGSVRGQNTAWAEELASRGYVVVALDHLYDSAAVVLDDGTVVTTHLRTDHDAEWNPVEWTTVRAADLRFALTQLETSRVADVLDLDRVAVTGHSMGGSAALMAARQDHRFTAVVNLDGFPYDPAPEPLPQPVLVLNKPPTGGENPDYLPTVDRVLALSQAGGYRLEVEGTTHETFTDAPIWLGPQLPFLVGTRGPEVTWEVTTLFLDHTLRGSGPDPSMRDQLARYGSVHTAG